MVINYPDGLGVDAEMVYQLLWLLSLYLAMIGGEDITPPPQLQECFDSSHLHIGPETKPFSRRFSSPLLFSFLFFLFSLASALGPLLSSSLLFFFLSCLAFAHHSFPSPFVILPPFYPSPPPLPSIFF